MSDQIKNPSKPAFAAIAMSDNDSFHQEGLTKREYFAAMAMQGFISNPNHTNAGDDEVVMWSQEIADRMIDYLDNTPISQFE